MCRYNLFDRHRFITDLINDYFSLSSAIDHPRLKLSDSRDTISHQAAGLSSLIQTSNPHPGTGNYLEIFVVIAIDLSL